jgi:hypothetical protein
LIDSDEVEFSDLQSGDDLSSIAVAGEAQVESNSLFTAPHPYGTGYLEVEAIALRSLTGEIDETGQIHPMHHILALM